MVSCFEVIAHFPNYSFRNFLPQQCIIPKHYKQSFLIHYKMLYASFTVSQGKWPFPNQCLTKLEIQVSRLNSTTFQMTACMQYVETGFNQNLKAAFFRNCGSLVGKSLEYKPSYRHSNISAGHENPLL